MRHRLEFAADLPPSIRSNHRETVTARQPALAIDETDVARTTSSAQVILAEVNRHKRGVALTLTAALAVVTILGVMVYRALNRRAANALVVPFSPVPFSSLPGRENQAAFSPDGKQVALIWDGGLGGRRMLGNIEMQHAPAVVGQHNQDVKHAKGCGRDGQEIAA